MEEKQHDKTVNVKIIPDQEFSDTFSVKINGSAPTFGEQQDLCDLFQNAYETYKECKNSPSKLLKQKEVLLTKLKEIRHAMYLNEFSMETHYDGIDKLINFIIKNK